MRQRLQAALNHRTQGGRFRLQQGLRIRHHVIQGGLHAAYAGQVRRNRPWRVGAAIGLMPSRTRLAGWRPSNPSPRHLQRKQQPVSQGSFEVTAMRTSHGQGQHHGAKIGIAADAADWRRELHTRQGIEQLLFGERGIRVFGVGGLHQRRQCRQARAVRQKVGNGDLPVTLSRQGGALRQVARDGVVEFPTALFHQVGHEKAEHRLGDGADFEGRLHRRRPITPRTEPSALHGVAFNGGRHDAGARAIPLQPLTQDLLQRVCLRTCRGICHQRPRQQCQQHTVPHTGLKYRPRVGPKSTARNHHSSPSICALLDPPAALALWLAHLLILHGLASEG